MRLKENVQVPPQYGILMAIWVAYDELKRVEHEMTITSWMDGRHSPTSLHYRGDAIDIRTRDLPAAISAENLGARIRERLTIDYDVIVEDTHIHIEWQPRLRLV